MKCPICQRADEPTYYGPCIECRDGLRARAAAQAGWRGALNIIWPGRMNPTEGDYG